MTRKQLFQMFLAFTGFQRKKLSKYCLNDNNDSPKPNGYPSELWAEVFNDTRIDLSWVIGSTNHDGHKIYISSDGINYTLHGSVLGNTATYSVTGLTALTHYWFKVCAYKSSGKSAFTNPDDEVTIPSYLSDGHTKLFMLAHLKNKITKDSANRVQTILSLIGTNFNSQATLAKRPLWNYESLRFDGDDDILQTGAMTLNQPLKHYFVSKQQTATPGDRPLDGLSATVCIQQDNTTGGIKGYAGDWSLLNSDWLLHHNRIVRFAANGNNSTLRIQNFVEMTGTWGLNNPGGITIGCGRSDASNFFNGEFKALLTRDIIDTSEHETEFYNYLSEKFYNGRKAHMIYEGHSMINLLELAGDIPVTDLTEQKLKNKFGIKLRHSCNVATGGYTIDQITAGFATRVLAYKNITPGLGIKNFLTLFIGCNDIAGGETGLSAYNALKSYWTTAVANDFIPIIITMTKYGTDAGVEAQRVVFNDLIRTDTDFNYIVDTDLIPELSDNENLTYFNPDKIHLITAGSDKLANSLYLVIKHAFDDNL